MENHELRLCRWTDGDERIDDALISVRSSPKLGRIVDIGLHGGARVVQRSLMMVQEAGARIVEAEALLADVWPMSSPIERELMPLILRAATRPVAAWLLDSVDRLRARVQEVMEAIRANRFQAAAAELRELLDQDRQSRYLTEGVRVVLGGEPNAGKSSLANALAGIEEAIVSDVPGTTRDWVENSGAIDGVPFTYVDTAGLRETADPIERESVIRAREQFTRADLILEVIDASLPAGPGTGGRLLRTGKRSGTPVLVIWNKCDLGLGTGVERRLSEARENHLVVSCLTGAGLPELQWTLLSRLGLTDWASRLTGPLSPALTVRCRQALSAVETSPPASAEALAKLQLMIQNADAEEAGR